MHYKPVLYYKEISDNNLQDRAGLGIKEWICKCGTVPERIDINAVPKSTLNVINTCCSFTLTEMAYLIFL